MHTIDFFYFFWLISSLYLHLKKSIYLFYQPICLPNSPIEGDDVDGDVDEFDIFPVIGQCKALYPFEGQFMI